MGSDADALFLVLPVLAGLVIVGTLVWAVLQFRKGYPRTRGGSPADRDPPAAVIALRHPKGGPGSSSGPDHNPPRGAA